MKTHTAIPEALSLVPSTYLRPLDLQFKGSDTFSWSLKAPTRVAHTHTVTRTQTKLTKSLKNTIYLVHALSMEGAISTV